MKLFLLAVFTLCTSFARDQNPASTAADDRAFSGESEASAVVISGNADNETYSAKTKNTYKLTESNWLTAFAKYIRAISTGTETAKSWEAGLRYDRVFKKDVYNGFLQHKAENDPYNGVFIQRDSSDIGVKYTIEKNDDGEWVGEFGYRYAKTYVNMESGVETADFLRIFTEASHKISGTASANLGLEHLPNLRRSRESQSNAEASLTVAVSTVFSLKTSYLLNHNEATLPPGKKDTTTWTTALVAKY